nr:MFS transporter [Zhihengliuella flava]
MGGAGLAAGVTVGALLVQELFGYRGAAGLPAAMFTLGAAVTAYVVGRLTQRAGRRTGLAAGFAAGGLGGFGVVAAAVTENLVLLFIAFAIYGAGTATNLQARYAGSDLADPTRRGRAVSVAMVATTIGAVAGPNLVEPMGRVALALGLPALTGPFLLSGAAYLAAGGVLWAFLRPDPLLVARALEEADDAEATPARTSPSSNGVRPAAYVGAAVMVLIQIAMVAVMTMTPLHLRAHGHGLSDVGLVIGAHIAAMYLPSLVTGQLVDRVGRTPVAIAAGATLLAAGAAAALAPADSLGWMIVALILLGLGWNFGLISGTALVVDGTEPENRPRVQGSIDVLISLAGAGGGAASGVVMATSSFAALSLGSGVLALAFLPVLWWARSRSRRG